MAALQSEKLMIRVGKPFLAAALPILIPALILAVIVAHRHLSIRRGRALEMQIAQMPLGITAADADALVGNEPDSIQEEWGVMMNPRTMLSATNSKAGSYGPPQRYVLRTWTRGDVSAAVAIDAEGRVAGRWSWR